MEPRLWKGGKNPRNGSIEHSQQQGEIPEHGMIRDFAMLRELHPGRGVLDVRYFPFFPGRT